MYIGYIWIFWRGDRFEEGDAQTANLIGPTLVQEFPEVLEQVRLYRFEKVTFKSGEKILEENKGALADGSYFEIFTILYCKGHLRLPLSSPTLLYLLYPWPGKFLEM